MYKLIAPIAFIALLGACTSKSTSSTNVDKEEVKTNNLANSSSGGSSAIANPDIFVCDNHTEYSVALSGEAADRLSNELTFTDFRFIAEESTDTILFASTGASMLDQLRMDLGEFPLQNIATAKDSDVLLRLDELGITLQIGIESNAGMSYHLDCENLFSQEENTCESVIVNLENRSVKFADAAFGDALSLNGTFSWEQQDTYNSGRPSCLLPAESSNMIGVWDATIDYGGGFVDVAYYEFTANNTFTIYDYLGDTAFQGDPMDCYYADRYVITNTEENGAFSFFSEEFQDSFTLTIRLSGENRISSFFINPPESLSPTNKTPEDFPLCNF